ncbi:uncharacterized protein CXorf58 homolog [Gastrophryne carolinensis]
MELSGMSSTSISISLPTSASLESLPATRNHAIPNLPVKRNMTDLRAAAICIQRAWRTYQNQKLFKLLRHAIRAAESCAAYRILKKVSPLEAELVKDPGMKCKVRFRFAGYDFPPYIVFKIFHHSGGHSTRYISGKRVINPSSEAATDARKVMGHRAYFEQVIYDHVDYQKNKVTDIVDVATFKDYMQYASHLDETPARLGGRDNCWRRLSLKNMPRTTILYDILDYAESGNPSDRLKEEINVLLQIPRNESMKQRQLHAITQYRSLAPPPSSPISTCLSSRYSTTCRRASRRSHKACLKVEKMKKLYGLGKEEQVLTDNSADITQNIFPESKNTLNQEVFSDEDWEEEAEKLYAWSQSLPQEESESTLLYQLALPFGIAAAPSIFTKILAKAMCHISFIGNTIIPYLDVLLFTTSSETTLRENVAQILSLLQSLGWIVNKEKFCLTPIQTCRFLGNIFNSSRQMIFLPPEKQEKLMTTICLLITMEEISLREIWVLGLMIATISSFAWAQLHFMQLQAFLMQVWDRFLDLLAIPAVILKNLEWWLNLF